MDKQQTEYERKMARLNNSVITLKNIDNEDFEHTFDGFPYYLKAGETLPFQYPVGMLLAKHLAMKILRRKAQKEASFGDKRDRKSINLYKPTDLQGLISQIIVGREDKPLPPEKSEGQIMHEKTLEMQKNYPQPDKPTSSVTKKEVIDELKKRNVKHDPRDTKENLLALLTEAEMQGNTGEEDEE